MKSFKSFRQFTEEASKPIAFTFGRFNPPTIGHEKLIEAVSAQGVPFRIYVSQSQDPKKNPLSYSDKVSYMRRMFSSYGRQIIKDDNIKTMFDIAPSLYNEGFTDLIMVVGEDRVPEFKKLLNDYNGKEVKDASKYYKFDSIKVVSAGDRDPDGEGVEGMSASKMRAAAEDDDYQSFVQGLPKTFKDGQDLFNDVRAGMGLEESTNFRPHIDLGQKDNLRERYLMNKVFNLDDSVMDKKTNSVWTITERHSNFVVATSVDEEETKKFFLHDLIETS